MAVIKYKTENGEYVAIPAGIPSNVSVFNNDANYQTEEQVNSAITTALNNIDVAEEGAY